MDTESTIRIEGANNKYKIDPVTDTEELLHKSLLVCGGSASGKTTCIRDLIRLFSVDINNTFVLTSDTSKKFYSDIVRPEYIRSSIDSKFLINLIESQKEKVKIIERFSETCKWISFAILKLCVSDKEYKEHLRQLKNNKDYINELIQILKANSKIILDKLYNISLRVKDYDKEEIKKIQRKLSFIEYYDHDIEEIDNKTRKLITPGDEIIDIFDEFESKITDYRTLEKKLLYILKYLQESLLVLSTNNNVLLIIDDLTQEMAALCKIKMKNKGSENDSNVLTELLTRGRHSLITFLVVSHDASIVDLRKQYRAILTTDTAQSKWLCKYELEKSGFIGNPDESDEIVESIFSLTDKKTGGNYSKMLFIKKDIQNEGDYKVTFGHYTADFKKSNDNCNFIDSNKIKKTLYNINKLNSNKL